MSEWISVDDHLPLNGDRVLVVSNGIVYGGWFQAQHNTWMGSVPNKFRDHQDGKYENVTYWQPMPEPPKNARG